MKNVSGMAIIVIAVAIGSGIVWGQSVICGRPDCDCTVLQSSTTPCATGVTLCTGVTPIYNAAKAKYECADATHVEPDWPKGCKPSDWYVDDFGNAYYYSTTNCNDVNTNCSRSTHCQALGSPPHCEPQPGGQFGNWTAQKKPTVTDCFDGGL